MVKKRTVEVVVTSTGLTNFFDVSAGETGSVLRAKVARRLGTPFGDVVMTIQGKVIKDDDVFIFTNNANNMFGPWGAYLPWFALGGVVSVAVVADMLA
jgi:hypothetical protein